jgi:formate dehydrogenase subunit gamma
MSDRQTTVGRYTTGARINHWITAITLVLLALSGMAFFHPALFFFAELFGGGAWARIIHPWLGVLLLVSFSGLFLRFWKFNIWDKTDTQWMKQTGDVLNAREEKLPEVGRYNAGQKLVFWAMSILIVALFVSGVMLWDTYFASNFTIETKRWAALAHALAAFVIISVWIIHVYAAIWVKGTVRAMTRGSVTGGWAWRHHRKWLRDESNKGAS